jgi:hypothetical protein
VTALRAAAAALACGALYAAWAVADGACHGMAAAAALLAAGAGG